ncbi:regulation of nuclear pre-mRNA domain-containing protein 1B-like [Ylistrum balloti]|uniref:regulation of nuclear pre-mRNA domain-containing protein 1B-like n=1 Tax=Ylistrum balloti TaxID=509963 RepID=UPI002905B618|nr:regulation of nuclear pre-mRNA domain-containing protein 1B-like [Ylistrum balloti]
MSSFSDSSLSKKLNELNNTQQSIQTLSLWLIHHRKHSKTIVQVWQREMQKVKSAVRLTFMYLANDVIQNSKKKGPELTRDFATVLPDAYAVAAKDSDEKTKKSLERILNIWQERGVYDKTFVSKIKQETDLGKSNSQTTEKTKKRVDEYVATKPKHHKSKSKQREREAVKHVSEPVAPVAVVPAKKKKKEDDLSLIEEIEAMPNDPSSNAGDSEALVKRLADLEHSASSDAAVREKIAALPPEVSDIQHLSKVQDKEAAVKLASQVEEACILLSEYNFRLNAELEERKAVGKMLRDFIVCQREQLREAESKVEDYKSRLEKVTSVRTELSSHIQNLPDLTLLPDVTGGLAPLPSAGDLFSLDQRH